MIPSGSAEERVVWLHVEAVDASGALHHLPVDAKGFEGEELTIASADALAYQDIGDIKELKDFPGIKRDGNVPAGDRIFRLPYLDEHMSRRTDHRKPLFSLLAFDLWCDATYGEGAEVPVAAAVN